MDTNEHNYFIASIKFTLTLLRQGHINPTLFRLSICRSIAEDLEISDLSKSIDSIYNKVANNCTEEAVKELENLREQLIQSAEYFSSNEIY